MRKNCAQCGGSFAHDQDIVAVIRTTFNLIPSRIHFSIADPSEVYEMQHFECAIGDLVPDNDMPGLLD